jgi:hypothetical protein
LPVDIHDEPGSPELDRRAVADERSDGGAALLADREINPPHHLRGGVDILVLPCQVHPEEEPTHLGADLALGQLVLPEALRVQHATAGANFQEGSFVQFRPLHAAAGTGAVTRARGARDRIPDVVEPTVWVDRVLVCLLRRDSDGRLVDEDVGIDHRVRDSR